MGRRKPTGPRSDVDRLVEAGLAAYGRGEVDDALVAWEQALAIDPDDTRALGYVDYVRQHYELVMSGGQPILDPESVPFGVGDDDGGYDVEITIPRVSTAPGPYGGAPRLPRGSTPPVIESRSSTKSGEMDAVDEGWSLEDDVIGTASTLDATSEAMSAFGNPASGEYAAMEVETDEPPDFDNDRTNEYNAGAQPPPSRGLALGTEADDPADGFQAGQQSTGGFGSGDHRTPDLFDTTTDINQKNLGFVQPRNQKKTAPELKVTIRTPDTRADTTPEDDRRPRTLSEMEAAAELELGPSLADLLEPEETTPVPSPSEASKKTEDFGPKIGGFVEAVTEELPNRARQVQIASDLRADTIPEPAPPRTRTAEARTKLVAEVDREAPPGGETRDQRTRRRITALITLALQAARARDLDRAIVAIDAAFSEEPDTALTQKLIQQSRDMILSVFHDYLGDLDRRPQLSRALHDVLDEPLDSRAAFLLSRVDGHLTYDELLDVSGMPRLEACRYLCQLVMRGLLTPE